MKRYAYYTSNELRPDGWLRTQLRIQADGLHGKLDKIWPDICNSKWIGGGQDTNTPGGIWGERVPYWLDGFIPLAHLLDDADMMSRAKNYIDTLISRQKPDGWICPCEDEERAKFDPWIIFLIGKMLKSYIECTNDEEAFQALYRIFKNYYNHQVNDGFVLHTWGKYRWFDGLIPIHFLHERTGEDWLVDLARRFRDQGADYTKFTEMWKTPLNLWQFETHIVNIAMMFKHEAVVFDLLGEEYTDSAQKLLDLLETYNGTAIGLITGDECLAGISPVHGTELCAVVEQLFSYETIFAHTGDFKWLDRMETIAFNALPAQFDERMETHQYLQLANQMASKRFFGWPPFRTNPDGAHLFAFDRIWGCCTSNFGQGWPKFALSAFAHDETSVLSLFAVPCELNTPHQRIKVITDYPFRHTVRYEVEAHDAFTFRIRIPSFVEGLTVDGVDTTPTNELTYAFEKGETRVIEVGLHFTPQFVSRPLDLTAVRFGPLFFSLPIAYDTVRRECESPYYETELHPKSDWSLALCSDELEAEFAPIGEVPFSQANPPISLRTRAVPIDWGYLDGYTSVCAKVPNSRTPIGDVRPIKLIPYGAAKLRMTELPKL